MNRSMQFLVVALFAAITTYAAYAQEVEAEAPADLETAVEVVEEAAEAAVEETAEAVEEVAEPAVQESIVVSTPDSAVAEPEVAPAAEPAVAEPAVVAEAPIIEETPTPVVDSSLKNDDSITVELPEDAEAPVDSVVTDVYISQETIVPETHTVHAPMACCPTTVVDTRMRLSARLVFRKSCEERKVSVCVENPACKGTLNNVPLCVPCCVDGAAQVCNPRCSLLGRGKVDLVWDCGFQATITFLATGDAVVTYSAG